MEDQTDKDYQAKLSVKSNARSWKKHIRRLKAEAKRRGDDRAIAAFNARDFSQWPEKAVRLWVASL